mgnify:CR=1 FL=1
MIRTPHLAVDGIIRVYEGSAFQGIVLISRKNPPLGLAFPGGFVDIGESCEVALKREMLEEVSLHVKIIGLLGLYSEPSRDSRFHCASAVYVCDAFALPKAADDAKEAFVILPEIAVGKTLAFDHPQILHDYLKSEFHVLP